MQGQQSENPEDFLHGQDPKTPGAAEHAAEAGVAAAPEGAEASAFEDRDAQERAKPHDRAGAATEPGYDGAPSLEETLGLRGEGRATHRHHGLRERLSGAVGGVFLGRGFRFRETPRESAAEGGDYSSRRVWGWRGGWPVLFGVALGAGLAAAPPVQHAVSDGFERMRSAMLSRPELAIRRLEVTGMRNLSEEALKHAVQAGGEERAAFAFNYKEARRRIEALGWVEQASVMLQPPNTLAIEIIERRPAAIWRRGAALTLVDPTGVAIAPAAARARHPGLPLLVGPGADDGVAEALKLARIAEAGGLRVAAFTRVGKRRWDLDLSSGLRLMLPEHEPKHALEKAVKMAREASLLERGFEIVDLRLPFAPTARPRPLGEQG